MRLADVDDLPTVLDTETAADLLGISADTLWRLAREGEAPIEPLRLGRALRWPTARLLDLLGLAEAPTDYEHGERRLEEETRPHEVPPTAA